MNAILEVTFCGRRFTAQEVELMRVVARDYAGLGVTEIARNDLRAVGVDTAQRRTEKSRMPATAGASRRGRSADASRSPQAGRARHSASESIPAALRT